MPVFNRHSAHLFKRAIESGITSPSELSNLMGQTSVESAQFTHLEERFGYKSADRVIAKVNSILTRRTRSEVEEAVASNDPERIANTMYDGSTTLQNTQSGDGWRFRGRGVIQLTGRYNYEHFGRKVGVDLIESPDLAKDPAVSADIAVAYWKERLRTIDPTDIRAATKKINGAYSAYDERVAAAGEWATIITPELIDRTRQASATIDDLLAMNSAQTTEFHASIRKGAHGDDVRELQTQLHNLGYPVRADGEFGPATRDAVMAFQRNHGLAADGIAGPKTLANARETHDALRDNRGPYTDEAKSDLTRDVSRNSSVHEMFEALCQAGANRDIDALCHVGKTYRSTPEGQDWLTQGELRNANVAAESLAAQQAQIQAQQEQQRGPVMSR